MGTEWNMPDTETPGSAASDAADPERIAALNRQISRDMHPPAPPVRYGWLLLLALSVVVAVVAFAVLSVSRRVGGAAGSQVGRLDQVYKQTQQALQQNEFSCAPVGQSAPPPNVFTSTSCTGNP
jgi:hypothetical protein